MQTPGRAGGARRSDSRRSSDLAAELGYADQAHFTRDVKVLTGMTPGGYLADQRPDSE